MTALRAFEVAVRVGSFTAAAAELGVTHGAVSKQVAALEAWLGQPLFHRAGQKMSPTPYARSFAKEISDALNHIAEAAQRYGAAPAIQVLRVVAPATFAMRWLIPRLPQFYEAHPTVEVRTSTSTTLNNTLRGAFDIAIQRGPEPWEQYEATEFLEEWDTLVASPALLAAKPVQALQDIAGHAILSTGTRAGDWEDWLAAAGYDGPPPSRRHVFDHYFVTRQAALEGFGLAIGPFPVLSDDVDQRRLVTPFQDIRVSRRKYFALTPYDVTRTVAVRSFIQWLVAEGEISNKSAAAGPP